MYLIIAIVVIIIVIILIKRNKSVVVSEPLPKGALIVKIGETLSMTPNLKLSYTNSGDICLMYTANRETNETYSRCEKIYDPSNDLTNSFTAFYNNNFHSYTDNSTRTNSFSLDYFVSNMAGSNENLKNAIIAEFNNGLNSNPELEKHKIH